MGELFYPDLPKDEQQRLLGTLTKHPAACSFFSPNHQAYAEMDTAFFYCEKDTAIPLLAQEAMIGAIKQQGIPVREEYLASGHFPTLSMPGVLADKILGLP